MNLAGWRPPRETPVLGVPHSPRCHRLTEVTAERLHRVGSAAGQHPGDVAIKPGPGGWEPSGEHREPGTGRGGCSSAALLWGRVGGRHSPGAGRGCGGRPLSGQPLCPQTQPCYPRRAQSVLFIFIAPCVEGRTVIILLPPWCHRAVERLGWEGTSKTIRCHLPPGDTFQCPRELPAWPGALRGSRGSCSGMISWGIPW